jgi:hypothetical protein
MGGLDTDLGVDSDVFGRHRVEHPEDPYQPGPRFKSLSHPRNARANSFRCINVSGLLVLLIVIPLGVASTISNSDRSSSPGSIRRLSRLSRSSSAFLATFETKLQTSPAVGPERSVTPLTILRSKSNAFSDAKSSMSSRETLPKVALCRLIYMESARKRILQTSPRT